MRKSILLILGILALGAAIGFGSSRATEPSSTQLQGHTCVTGQFLINTEYGLVVIGDQQICGIDLRFSDISGPSKRQPKGGSSL